MLCKIPGGGGTPLHKQYRYVPPHRVGFLRRLGLEIKSNHCVKCLTTYVLSVSKDLHVLFVSRFFEVTFRLFSYPRV